MSVLLKNNIRTKLAADINTTDTSISVDTGTGSDFPVLGPSDWFYITVVEKNSLGIYPEVLEIMKVTAVSGDTLTVERGVDGTSAISATIGDIIEMRLTNSTLVDLNKKTDKRIYLDEVILAMSGQAYPTSTSELRSRNQKFAPLLLDQWDAIWGPSVKCKILNTTTDDEYDGLKFTTLNDIITWLNDNTPGGVSAHNMILLPYDEIDNSIPHITKMNGFNRSFYALKGKLRYTVAGTGSAIHANDQMLDACADMYNNVHGPATPVASTDGSNLLGTIWVGNAKKNKYGYFGFDKIFDSYSIYFPYGTGNSRYAYNDTDKAYVSANDGWGGGAGRYIKSTLPQYLVFNTPSSYYVLDDLINDRKSINEDMNNGASVLAIIGVEDESDNKKKAIVVRPMGIDTIVTNLFDWSKYDLEIVYSNSDMQNYVYIKRLTSSDFDSNTDMDTATSRLRITSNKWLCTCNDNMATKWSPERKPHTVRFRLRDKSTGKVGELSYSGIVTERRRHRMFRVSTIKSFI